jgi:hypothetical protein
VTLLRDAVRQRLDDLTTYFHEPRRQRSRRGAAEGPSWRSATSSGSKR